MHVALGKGIGLTKWKDAAFSPLQSSTAGCVPLKEASVTIACRGITTRVSQPVCRGDWRHVI